MRLSKPTLALAIFIILSGTFTRQLLNFAYDIFGKGPVQISLAVLFVALAVVSIPYLIRATSSNITRIVFFAVLCLGLYLSWQQKLFAERIHMLEYGVLGWFIVRDFSRHDANIKGIIVAVFIAGLFGVADEILQLLLPYRVWDLRDIGFNFLGGIWGISLFAIKAGR